MYGYNYQGSTASSIKKENPARCSISTCDVTVPITESPSTLNQRRNDFL